jgi:hypothetical protein
MPGCLVASLATDDTDFASRVAEQLQAFKVGINRPRSRGDREEVFGGMGESWKGALRHDMRTPMPPVASDPFQAAALHGCDFTIAGHTASWLLVSDSAHIPVSCQLR